MLILILIGGLKIATANQSPAMVIIRLQQIALGSLSVSISLNRVSLFSFVFPHISDFTIIGRLCRSSNPFT